MTQFAPNIALLFFGFQKGKPLPNYWRLTLFINNFFIGCAHAFGEHNHCSLTYIIIIIIFAPLRISQYLDYIDNACVKRFVLNKKTIEQQQQGLGLSMSRLRCLSFFVFMFRCTVEEVTKFLWQKVPYVNEWYSVLAYVTTSTAHVSKDAWTQSALMCCCTASIVPW